MSWGGGAGSADGPSILGCAGGVEASDHRQNLLLTFRLWASWVPWGDVL